ncbi:MULTISPECIES: DUF2059 domain-containing protein [Bizionia]|uniref:DUF2059 domain-containing protein n=1 Tax=Bizionia algoritergicola TaxID=291187 RepID=A0A5D0R1U5_9FLAO|nr:MULTISPECIES: DUF2059 domain-containing protein [Bizionia]OBX21854.1 hypothetical protein BAA08_10920 [Bizionia sp. APA-3]TYB75049.1 DUF2059 domain-containing protein [Bizionia algoritergicola]
MKTLFSVLVLFLTLSISAQEPTEFKKQTMEFIGLTGATGAFGDAIAQIGAMVPEANKAAFTKEANGTLDKLYGQLAEVYMEEFTQDEIKELVAFYKTDLGKKLASKQSLLTQKGMMLGQSWGMEVGQIAQKHTN